MNASCNCNLTNNKNKHFKFVLKVKIHCKILLHLVFKYINKKV